MRAGEPVLAPATRRHRLGDGHPGRDLTSSTPVHHAPAWGVGLLEWVYESTPASALTDRGHDQPLGVDVFNDICSESACERLVGRHGARGLCKMHYERWRSRNPSAVNPPRVYPPGSTAYERMEIIGWDRTSSGCWEWRGSRDGHGYGYVSHGKSRRAHIVAYEHANGPLAHGQIVRHTCDHPPCVNPAHLLAGTQKQNVQDALDRGRFRPHGRVPGCGLTPDDHSQIRALWESGEWSQRQLAGHYGVGATTIFRILHAET